MLMFFVQRMLQNDVNGVVDRITFENVVQHLLQ